MLTVISLRDFAINGNFGPVKLGMKKEIAIQLLGKPDADIDYGTSASGLTYGWYELFYNSRTHKIMGMQNDHLMVRQKNHKDNIYFETDKAKIDKWFLKYTKNITYNDTLAILDKENIGYSIVTHLVDVVVKFTSGVCLDFDIDPKKGEKVLNGIRFWQ